MRIVIRSLRHADLDAVVALSIAADDAERVFSPDLVVRRPDRRHFRRGFKRMIFARDTRLLLACDRSHANRVVGMLGIDLTRARHRYVIVRRHVYLHTMFVLPAYRGAGVARRLIRAALDWARRRDAWQARLEMAAPNHRARGVYESAGFRVREMFFTRDLRAF